MCFGIDLDGLYFVCNKKITVIKPLMFCLLNKMTFNHTDGDEKDSYSVMFEIQAVKKV